MEEGRQGRENIKMAEDRKYRNKGGEKGRYVKGRTEEIRLKGRKQIERTKD